MRKTIVGHELRSLNGKYDSGSQMRKMTLDREHKVLNGIEMAVGNH